MLIDQVNVYQVTLPFAGTFSHSRKKAASGESIIVEVLADQGETKGYGEGAPRPYVTGETRDIAARSVQGFLKKDIFPWRLDDVAQIWNFIDQLPGEKYYNAAICALEMSLLDALARSQAMSVIDYFPDDFLGARVYYGAAIPLADSKRIDEICKLIQRLGIDKLRIKMGKDLDRNRDLAHTVRSVFGDDCDLRADVNGAWDRELALQHLQLIEDYTIKIVEQPMMPFDPDIAYFVSAIGDSKTILMADESACSFEDVEGIISKGYYGMVNVRLSKCGGFRRSLRIIDLLRESGILFQIGCQLGESGILSSAGRTLGLLCRDAQYYDGSYDALLLSDNITFENVCFGPGGEAGRLCGPGLGVEIDVKRLRRLCDTAAILTIRKF